MHLEKHKQEKITEMKLITYQQKPTYSGKRKKKELPWQDVEVGNQREND